MDPEALADAYAKEGDALLAKRKTAEAIALYDRAIEVHPESCEAWTRKAVALKAMGRFRESLECVERALEIYQDPIAEELRDSLRPDADRG
ncbi:MAG: tetratricopeptide repeat protein [Thermodesulfobacteriota bacterium]